MKLGVFFDTPFLCLQIPLSLPSRCGRGQHFLFCAQAERLNAIYAMQMTVVIFIIDSC